MNWDILLKYINNETIAAENKEVVNWLDEQRENQYLLDYLKIRKEQLQQPLKETDIDKQWLLLLDRMFDTNSVTSSPKNIKLYRFIGIAASLLLISTVTLLFLRSSLKIAHDQEEYTLQTKTNSRGKMILPDGTELYLAPDSKITYNNSFGEEKRMIHLSGEAFFNVIHNTHKPFIIYTQSKIAVTVLGTSFNIYSREKKPVMEVKVATGLVGVVENNHTHFLKAGEQMSYRNSDKQVITKKIAHNDAAALQKETLFFNNNNADEIAQKLERWYNITVTVLPSARKRPEFSGEMKDTGLIDLMKGLRYATGIKYQYKNSQNIILY